MQAIWSDQKTHFGTGLFFISGWIEGRNLISLISLPCCPIFPIGPWKFIYKLRASPHHPVLINQDKNKSLRYLNSTNTLIFDNECQVSLSLIGLPWPEQCDPSTVPNLRSSLNIILMARHYVEIDSLPYLSLNTLGPLDLLCIPTVEASASCWIFIPNPFFSNV